MTDEPLPTRERSVWSAMDSQAALATGAPPLVPAPDPAHIARILDALARKYRWQMAVGNFFARLTGRFNRRSYIELDFQP